MAHFAKIDSGNVVVHVEVVNNADIRDENGNELEANGIAHLERHGVEAGTRWVQTSYNTFAGAHKLGGVPLRKNYAGVGYSYDAVRGAFIPPQPYPSWSLDEDTCLWDAPIPHPADGETYVWDEETLTWVLPL